MASMWPLFLMFLVIFMSSPSLILSFTATSLADDEPQLPTSTISAAPALLPDSPLASPPAALTPDITPLFPSPGGSELSPSDSSLPTIPSSPSPPNPDAISAPGPALPMSPFGSLPISTSHAHPLQVSSFPLSSVAVSAVVALCW